MALLFCEGFDNADFNHKWTGSGSTASTTRFGAGLCFVGGTIKKMFTSSNKIIVGMAIKVSGGVNGDIFVLYGDSGTSPHLSIQYNNPAFNVYRWGSGVPLARVANKNYIDKWVYLEIAATIADAGGTVEVRIDGESIASYTGDTRNGGTSTLIDALQIQNSCSYDDLYICNDTGTSNNTFLGDVRIQTLLPAANGSSTQFTPTSGANYTTVNDVPDVTTSYNYSVTVGDRDTYAMGDLLGNTGTILGVQENIHAWKSDAGLASLQPALLASSTVYYAPAISLGSSIAWYGNMQEISPATSAGWTVSEVNGLEFGAEVA